MATTVKKLYKSRTDRMIAGVCGGTAAYLDVDPTLVRLAFIFLLFLGGLGFLLYLIALVIMPENPVSPDPSAEPVKRKEVNTQLWGVILIAGGLLIFLGNIGWSVWWRWWDIPWGVAFPIVLIAAGVWVVFGMRKQPPVAEAVPPEGAPRTNGTSRLYRSRSDSKLLGVCGGIGAYLNTDPTIVRILFVVATIVSAGLMIILYVIMGIVVPQEPPASVQA